MSGADFLKLRILRNLNAFHARISELEAIGNAAATQSAILRPDHRAFG